MSETNTNEDKYAKYPNLIRNSDLSSEERKARASKGGKASVKARRRKKELKMHMNVIIQMMILMMNLLRIKKYLKNILIHKILDIQRKNVIIQYLRM